MSSVRDRIRAFNSGESSEGDGGCGLDQPGPERIPQQPTPSLMRALPYSSSLQRNPTDHLVDASVTSISNGKHEPVLLHDSEAPAASTVQPVTSFRNGSRSKGCWASAANVAAAGGCHDSSKTDGCWESTAPSTPATSEVLPTPASPEKMPYKGRPRSMTSKQLQQAQQKQQDELDTETQQAQQAQTIKGAPSAAAQGVSPAQACGMQPCTGGSSEQSAGPECQPGTLCSAYGSPGHRAVRAAMSSDAFAPCIRRQPGGARCFQCQP